MQFEEQAIEKSRREILSELIIPLQAQIEILEYIKRYDKINCSERLNKLYKEVNGLREEYFTL